jgi:hypothetical protein
VGLLLAWVGERQLDSGLVEAWWPAAQGRGDQGANKVGSSDTRWGKAGS